MPQTDAIAPLEPEPGPAGRFDERQSMVATQLRARDIVDPRVLAAMLEVPRHCFVPTPSHSEAYADYPIPIGFGQTISQPYIVAFMAQLLQIGASDRVLEIGTGCGYQTAVLAKLARSVCTVEIVPDLARESESRLRALGITNVEFRLGDGNAGWPERSPFDGIVVAAAAETLPAALADQMADRGRLVIPLGERHGQVLHCFVRRGSAFFDDALLDVRFVPLVRAPPRVAQP